MQTKKVRITVYLNPDIYTDMKSFMTDNGYTMSRTVEDAIKFHLIQQQAEKAEKADEILADPSS